jgi:Glycosyltransferase 61
MCQEANDEINRCPGVSSSQLTLLRCLVLPQLREKAVDKPPPGEGGLKDCVRRPPVKCIVLAQFAARSRCLLMQCGFASAMKARHRRGRPLLVSIVRWAALLALLLSFATLIATLGYRLGQRTSDSASALRVVPVTAERADRRASETQKKPTTSILVPLDIGRHSPRGVIPFGPSIGRIIAAFVLLRIGFPVHTYIDCQEGSFMPRYVQGKPSLANNARWDVTALRVLCKHESLVATSPQYGSLSWAFPFHLYPWMRRYAASPLGEVWASFDFLDWHDFVPRTKAELIATGSNAATTEASAPQKAVEPLLSRMERDQAKEEILSSLLGYTKENSDVASLSPSHEWKAFRKAVDSAFDAMSGESELAAEGLGEGFSMAVVDVTARLAQKVLGRLGVAEASSVTLDLPRPKQPTAAKGSFQTSSSTAAEEKYREAASTLTSLSSAVPNLLSSQAELNTLRWSENDHGPLASLSQCHAARSDPCSVRSTLGVRGCIEDELCGWCPMEHLANPLGSSSTFSSGGSKPEQLRGLCLSRSLTRHGGPLRRESVGGQGGFPFCSSPRGLIVNALSVPSRYAKYHSDNSERDKEQGAVYQLHAEPVQGGFDPTHFKLQTGVVRSRGEPLSTEGFFSRTNISQCGLIITRYRPRLFSISTVGRSTETGLSRAAAQATMAFHFLTETAPKWFEAALEDDALQSLRQHIWLMPLATGSPSTSSFSYSWSSLFTNTCPRDLQETLAVLSRDAGAGGKDGEQLPGICYASYEGVPLEMVKKAHKRLLEEREADDNADISELLTGLPDPIPVFEADAALQQAPATAAVTLEPVMRSVWAGSRLGFKGIAAITKLLKEEATAMSQQASEDSQEAPLLSAVASAAADLHHFYSYRKPAAMPGQPPLPNSNGLHHASSFSSLSRALPLRGLEMYAPSHLGLQLWNEASTRAEHKRAGKCIKAGEEEEDIGEPHSSAKEVLPPLRATRPMVTLISRANKRFLVNEREVIAALLAAGLSGGKDGHTFFDVQLVTLESMPLYSQMLALQRSDVLIGVHGSGLLNAVFMRGQNTLPSASTSRRPSPLLIQLLPIGLGRGQGSQFFRGPALAAGVDYKEMGGQIGGHEEGEGDGDGSVGDDLATQALPPVARRLQAARRRIGGLGKGSYASNKLPPSWDDAFDVKESDLKAVSSRQHWHFAGQAWETEKKRRNLLYNPRGGEAGGHPQFFSFWINGDLRVENVTRLVEVVTERMALLQQNDAAEA